MDRPRVSVVIPAYNEEQSIVSAVESTRAALSPDWADSEIIVVDDGSTDSTAELARGTGARVFRHSTNHGYGAALKTGIARAEGRIIAITDADGTYPSERLPDLLERLEDSDMVVGARTGESVHIPPLRRPAKRLLRALAANITETGIPDLNSGLRVFRRSLALRYLHLLPSGFSFTTTITVASLCDDLEVTYIPIDYHEREGRSKIVPGHFFNFVLLVLRLAVLFRPLKVFVPAAAVCGILGLVKLMLDVVIAIDQAGLTASLFTFPIVSPTAVIFLVAALQLLLFGMVAESMGRRPLVSSEPYTRD